MTAKSRFFILASIPFILLGSCKSGEFTEELDIWPQAANFPDVVGPEGGAYTIQIESNGIWRISMYSTDENEIATDQQVDWITLSHTLGIDNEDVEITIAANNRLRERRATIEIMASRDSVTRNFKLPVRQAMPEEVVPYLDISSTNIGLLRHDPVNNLGGQREITLQSNATWRVEDIPEWMNVTPSEGEEDATISVTVLPNAGSAVERFATLRFSVLPERVTNVFSKDFYIEQNGAQSASLAVKKEGNGNFEAIPGGGYVPEGETPDYQLELIVGNGIEWTIELPFDWCKVDKSARTGTGNTETVTLTFEANPHKFSREAVFYVRTPNSSQRIYLNQYGKDNQHFAEPEPEPAPVP